MEPVCQEEDFVFVNPLSYFLSHHKAGDIVVLRHPIEKTRLILKRILKRLRFGSQLWYWVEGDNKESSQDSRSFGWVPSHVILGKAAVVRRSLPPH